MKKVKGFTLVELIVVTAIFGLIMVAVLSILNPISNVYESTANYEHMRAASDNVRLYIEDNIRYADRMQVLYNANDADAVAAAQAFADVYKDADDNYTISTSETPLYVMKLSNPDRPWDSIAKVYTGAPAVGSPREGEITIYKLTSGSISALGSAYRSANKELYTNYYYHFDASKLDWNNAVIGIDVFRKGFKDGSPVKLAETDEKFYKLSTSATFSFVNLRELQRKLEAAGTEIEYYNYDGFPCNADSPGAIEVNKAMPENMPFKGSVDKMEAEGAEAKEHNVYFIYTLPKYANEY